MSIKSASALAFASVVTLGILHTSAFGEVLLGNVYGNALEAPVRQSYDPIPPSCNIFVAGEIDLETAERLEELIRKTYSLEELLFHEVTACLDSTGGSFLGGLELGKRIHEFRLQTHVSSEARCHSACAIAFMFGRSIPFPPEGGLERPGRSIEPGASLAFHLPGRRFRRDTKMSGSSVQREYQTAQYELQQLVEASTEYAFSPGDPVFLNELLVKLMATPFDDIYEIRTLSEAFDAKVELKGVARAGVPDREAALSICNLLASREGHVDDFSGLIRFAHIEEFTPDQVEFFIGEYVASGILEDVPVFSNGRLFLSRTSMVATPYCLVGDGVALISSRTIPFDRSLYFGVDTLLTDLPISSLGSLRNLRDFYLQQALLQPRLRAYEFRRFPNGKVYGPPSP